MKIIIVLVVTIIVTILLCWAIGKLGETYYNIKALRYASKHPNEAISHNTGIVFNTKTNKLEADNSPITPF